MLTNNNQFILKKFKRLGNNEYNGFKIKYFLCFLFIFIVNYFSIFYLAHRKMKKDRSIKKAQSTEEESNESILSESGSGNELEYSNNQLEQAEELMEDVEISEEMSSEEECGSCDDENCEGCEESEETQSGSSEEDNEEDEETKRTIFIKDMGYDVKEDELKEQLQRIGEIVRVTIPMTHDQRRNKGFAYVEFKRLKDAEKAMKLDGTELLGRKIGVFPAKARSNRKIFTIFVKNLSYNTKKEELVQHFEQFGKVYNVSLPIDGDNEGRNKGFCFVEFTDHENVEKALKAKHILSGRTLYVNEGDKNEERNKIRSSDRLYGRKRGNEDSDRRGSRFRRDNNEDSDRRGSRFRRDNNEDSDRRGSRFRRDNNEESVRENKHNSNKKFSDKNFKGKKSFDKPKKASNKIVFDDSD